MQPASIIDWVPWWQQCPEPLDDTGNPPAYLEWIDKDDEWYCHLCRCPAPANHVSGKKHIGRRCDYQQQQANAALQHSSVAGAWQQQPPTVLFPPVGEPGIPPGSAGTPGSASAWQQQPAGVPGSAGEPGSARAWQQQSAGTWQQQPRQDEFNKLAEVIAKLNDNVVALTNKLAELDSKVNELDANMDRFIVAVEATGWLDSYSGYDEHQ